MIAAFDPGLGQSMPGGWCVMDSSDGALVFARELPAAGKTVDIPHIARTLDEYTDWLSTPTIVVEKQHARPQDSHRSMNVALPAYGQLIGMAQGIGWSLVIVDPKDWKSVVLRGTARDKPAACAYVAQRYPGVDLRPGRRRKAHDGIADAVCIAEWAYREKKAG